MRNPVPRSRSVSLSSASGGSFASNRASSRRVSRVSPPHRARGYDGYSSDACSPVMHGLFRTNEPVERRLTDDSNAILLILHSRVARRSLALHRGGRLIRKAMIGLRGPCIEFLPRSVSVHRFRNEYRVSSEDVSRLKRSVSRSVFVRFVSFSTSRVSRLRYALRYNSNGNAAIFYRRVITMEPFNVKSLANNLKHSLTMPRESSLLSTETCFHCLKSFRKGEKTDSCLSR